MSKTKVATETEPTPVPNPLDLGPQPEYDNKGVETAGVKPAVGVHEIPQLPVVETRGVTKLADGVTVREDY